MSDDNHVVEPGKQVEVITVQPGRVTSYYPATCLEIRGEKCRVKHVSKEDANGFSLIEDVPLDMVRPEPPFRHFNKFFPGDVVDCINQGGWWKCQVKNEGSKRIIWVTFEHPVGGQLHMAKMPGSLRIHQEWSRYNPGEWVWKKLSETGAGTDNYE